jgi:hypothetical protein
VGWALADVVNQTMIEAATPANIRNRPQHCFLIMTPLTFQKSGAKARGFDDRTAF